VQDGHEFEASWGNTVRPSLKNSKDN
jgi:hypothetical protein